MAAPVPRPRPPILSPACPGIAEIPYKPLVRDPALKSAPKSCSRAGLALPKSCFSPFPMPPGAGNGVRAPRDPCLSCRSSIFLESWDSAGTSGAGNEGQSTPGSIPALSHLSKRSRAGAEPGPWQRIFNDFPEGDAQANRVRHLFSRISWSIINFPG